MSIFLKEALHTACVHALAPTRNTISATFSVLKRTSLVRLLGGLRCGSSNLGWFELLPNMEAACFFVYLILYSVLESPCEEHGVHGVGWRVLEDLHCGFVLLIRQCGRGCSGELALV